jgi:hypothetical protein
MNSICEARGISLPDAPAPRNSELRLIGFDFGYDRSYFLQGVPCRAFGSIRAQGHCFDRGELCLYLAKAQRLLSLVWLACRCILIVRDPSRHDRIYVRSPYSAAIFFSSNRENPMKSIGIHGDDHFVFYDENMQYFHEP